MVQKRESNTAEQDQALYIENIKRRLDVLDNRLDNIDSMVTAVAERVMRQPVTLHIVCSQCGKNIEISIIGSEKPSQ